MVQTVYTIGHSTHAEREFVSLLERHGVTAVADVRSAPFSRRVPHFSKAPLKALLRAAGLAYVFLGRELGARTDDEDCYVGERVEFERLAQTSSFADGLARVRKGAASHRIALLCAESEPLYCHRAVLVARHLRGQGVEVAHILADGEIEGHEGLERRMLTECRMGEGDLFEPYAEQLSRAYRAWGERIAYRRSPSNPQERAAG